MCVQNLLNFSRVLHRWVPELFDACVNLKKHFHSKQDQVWTSIIVYNFPDYPSLHCVLISASWRVEMSEPDFALQFSESIFSARCNSGTNWQAMKTDIAVAWHRWWGQSSRHHVAELFLDQTNVDTTAAVSEKCVWDWYVGIAWLIWMFGVCPNYHAPWWGQDSPFQFWIYLPESS